MLLLFLISLVAASRTTNLICDPNMTSLITWEATPPGVLCKQCSSDPRIGPFVQDGFYLFTKAFEAPTRSVLQTSVRLPPHIGWALFSANIQVKTGVQYVLSLDFAGTSWSWSGHTLSNYTGAYSLLAQNLTLLPASVERTEDAVLTIVSTPGTGDFLSLNQVNLVIFTAPALSTWIYIGIGAAVLALLLVSLFAFRAVRLRRQTDRWTEKQDQPLLVNSEA